MPTDGSVEARSRQRRWSGSGGDHVSPAEPVRPLRVAQVIPARVHPYSGLLVSLCRLSAWLVAEGCEVELWQLGRLSPEAESLLLQAVEAGASRQLLPGPRVLNSISRLEAAIASRPVDLAHIHGVFNPLNVRVAAALRVPYVVTPHGGYAPESLAYHPLRKRAFRRLFELPMLREARGITALTHHEADQIRSFGVRSNIAIVPNGVDAPPVDIDPNAFRREYGIPTGAPLAVYVGRLDVRAKRLDDLLRGIAAAPEWRVALLGGDFRGGADFLRRKIERLGIADRAWIVPPRRGRQLHEVLAASDAFVLLSRSEGMPMALLEATAWGVPAMVSPEVDRALEVEAAGAGWRVDRERLARILEASLHEDDARRTARKEAARAFASRYTWGDAARAYAALYRRAVAGVGSIV